MIPASVVEQKKARETFEKEKRAGRATALVEHVKGNNFKCKVYPIPANSTKKIRLVYTAGLNASEDANRLVYIYI